MSPIVQKNFKSAVEVVRRAKDNIEELSTIMTEKSSELLSPERNREKDVKTPTKSTPTGLIVSGTIPETENAWLGTDGTFELKM